MTRFVNTLLVLSLLTAIGAAIASPEVQRSEQQSSRAAAQAAYREGGLRAAAHAAGGHYTMMTEWVPEIAYTLESLVQHSAVVLIGDLIENRGHISQSGEYITSDYRMRVHRALKGNIEPQEVVFQVVGGKVVFEDGSSAVMETKGFVRPNNGARVVIFASPFFADDPLMPPAVLKYANGAPIFRLVGMGRGIIELPFNEEERIRVNAFGAKDKATQAMRGKQVRAFLQELERTVKVASGRR